jgi:hypothetical protein
LGASLVPDLSANVTSILVFDDIKKVASCCVNYRPMPLSAVTVSGATAQSSHGMLERA